MTQEQTSDVANEFKMFSQDVLAKLQEQEARMTRLDRKAALRGQRPHLAFSDPIEAPHQKAFDAYLRSGDDEGLRGLELEGKAMSTAVSGDGGYLVAPQTAEGVRSVLNANASLRSIATVVTVDAGSYDVLIDRADLGAGWAGAAAAATETSTGVIEKISIPLHELSAMPKASQRLLDDSAFDLETWLVERIADKFARAEGAAFITGNGVDKPTGFLNADKAANAAWTWGKLGYTPSGASGTLGTGEALVDLVYSLGASYRAGASFLMNSKTTASLRKLKDAEGRFLWADGLAAGEPARLLGYPVVIAEDMPDMAADAYPVAFGNFARGYTIAERADLRLLRDPFSAKPHVLFYATKRVGGAVTDFAAIKLLKTATS